MHEMRTIAIDDSGVCQADSQFVCVCHAVSCSSAAVKTGCVDRGPAEDENSWGPRNIVLDGGGPDPPRRG